MPCGRAVETHHRFGRRPYVSTEGQAERGQIGNLSTNQCLSLPRGARQERCEPATVSHPCRVTCRRARSGYVALSWARTGQQWREWRDKNPMRRIFTRRVVVTRLGIAILSVTSLALGIAVWSVPRHSTQAASASTGPGLVETYTLITGDHVRVSRPPRGKPAVTILPASGGGGGGGGGASWGSSTVAFR